MELIRNENIGDGEANNLLPQVPQSYVQSVQPTPPPTDRVTYAQIVRVLPAQINLPNGTEQFDFRLQTPQQTSANNNLSPITSGRSSISEVSSGYIDLKQNLARPQLRKNVRPTSPETSF
jgi:hypothetical protein